MHSDTPPETSEACRLLKSLLEVRWSLIDLPLPLSPVLTLRVCPTSRRASKDALGVELAAACAGVRDTHTANHRSRRRTAGVWSYLPVQPSPRNSIKSGRASAPTICTSLHAKSHLRPQSD